MWLYVLLALVVTRFSILLALVRYTIELGHAIVHIYLTSSRAA